MYFCILIAFERVWCSSFPPKNIMVKHFSKMIHCHLLCVLGILPKTWCGGTLTYIFLEKKSDNAQETNHSSTILSHSFFFSLHNPTTFCRSRYVLIGYHASYLRIYTKTNIFLMILGVWVFSFGMMVPPLAEIWGYLGYKEDTFSCTILP